jgi:hypothetical protein
MSQLMIAEDKPTNDGTRWINWQSQKMSQMTMAKTDQPTAMLCPLGEENIIDNVTSTDSNFNNPLFILLAKYVYT